MVSLWRRRKFVRLVYKTIKKHAKNKPPSLDEMKNYNPTEKEVKEAFISKRKIWGARFNNLEANNICSEVVAPGIKYCISIVDGEPERRLQLEQKGKELCSLSGYFEELLKNRKRTSEFVLACLLSSAFTTLVIWLISQIFG